jgi:receptor protein-tyrosine kinase
LAGYAITLKEFGGAVKKRKTIVAVFTLTLFLFASLGSTLFFQFFATKGFSIIRFIIPLLFLVLGLGLGSLVAFFLELSDRSLGTIGELEKALRIPVLGVIPHWSRVSVAGTDLFALFAPESVEAREFRALRANLIYQNNKMRMRLVLITSAVPQAGRSVVAANLALTMAQHGKKTLLVGTVPGACGVASLFGLEPTKGFVDIMDRSHPWRDVVSTTANMILGNPNLEGAHQSPGLDRLHIITGGHRPPGSSQLRLSAPLRPFLKEIQEEYDHTFFDGPPMGLKVDPLLLAKEMDGVLFVARLGQVTKRQVKGAVDRITKTGGTCIGMVLNGMRPSWNPEFKE